MLSNVQLENFKSFKQLDNLKISPITVLCGSNSCGKSSILQSILLLKQTKESRTTHNSILLNGNYVHLGDAKNVIHGQKADKVITLKYEYTFNADDFRKLTNASRTVSSSQILHYLLPKKSQKTRTQEHRVTLTIKIKPSSEEKGYIKTSSISEYEINVVSNVKSDKEIQGANLKILSNDKNNTAKLSWSRLPDFNNFNEKSHTLGSIEKVLVKYENLFPILHQVNSSDNKSGREYRAIPFCVLNFLRLFDDFISRVNSHLSYIGPLREEPSRRYIYENETLDIGSKGENAAYIYQTEQQKQLHHHSYRFNTSTEQYDRVTNKSLREEVDHWMSFMGISGFCPDLQSEIIRLKMTANSCADTSVNIADVGFGVSQIFPILIEGLRMNASGTLLLEQPEIHLHPSLQMKMADFFISLALSGKNILIETHSDHIVNRLIRRTIENENLNGLISINFVSNSDQGAYIEEVQIDPLHGIVNWPDGFFDQTASEQEKIMLAGIKRRKLEREKNK